ncbi:prolyl oligopeptidase family serine peptidase [Gemmatimonadota bacterium]
MGRTLIPRSLAVLLIASFMIVSTDLPALAQTGEEILTTEAFLSPPDEIKQAVLAPRHENVSLSNRSPDGKYYLRTLSNGLPPMANYAKPFYRLAGTQIDPVANRSRRFTTRSDPGFELIEWETGNRIRVDAPAGSGISNPAWSPDGTKIAYFVHSDDATHIWVYNIADGRSRVITRAEATLTTLASSFSWTEDSANIVAVLLPADRGPEPAKPAVPTTPMVRLTEEGENALRIYASLLETPHDAALLEYHTTGQLSIIDVARRRATPIGTPDMIRSFNISPDGQYLRVTRMTRPFSYIVPMGNFGTVEEIWDLQGNVLYEIQKRELRTGLSNQGGGGGRPGAGGGGGDDRRALSWRPDGQGMSFLQMEPREKTERDTTDAGDEPAAEEVEEEEEEPRKDRVMQWHAPFDSTSAVVVYETEDRMSSVSYSADCRTLFITQSEGGTRTVYAVYLDDPETRYTISEHKTEDYYANPGSLMSKRGPMGGSVVRTSTDGNFVYLSGTESFEKWYEEAPKAFINQVEIRTGEVKPVYKTPDGFSERVQAMDDDLSQLMITRESPTQIGDSWLWTRATENMRKMTNNVDHTPDLTNAVRDRFEVTRVDGIKFWVTVTLPAGHVEGKVYPAMWWFYPREYTSQKSLDESKRRTNINAFPRVSTRGMVILTRLDYAIVEPDCPIMGSEGALNDVYTSDLRNNLYAVIQALDVKGYVDTDRMAIGGHSYGAFGTANAMIQTPFFRAGIAGDGNYNRLLTPAGFQSERRELWAAREIYLRMSPILWANELQGALLMYHGMHDQNTGTAPFHAPKMFHALNVLGKTASLYMYPYEDHGPATLETNLDMWARWIPWLDRYVKNYKEYEEEEKEDEGEGRGRGRNGG